MLDAGYVCVSAGHDSESCQTAEPIKMPLFRCQTHMTPVNHVLDTVNIGATWWIGLNDRARGAAAMRPMPDYFDHSLL